MPKCGRKKTVTRGKDKKANLKKDPSGPQNPNFESVVNDKLQNTASLHGNNLPICTCAASPYGHVHLENPETLTSAFQPNQFDEPAVKVEVEEQTTFVEQRQVSQKSENNSKLKKPFAHEEFVNIFEDVKPAIGLKDNRLIIAEIDVDLSHVKEEIPDEEEYEEMEEDRLMEMADSIDSQLDSELDAPNDQESNRKGSRSLKKQPIHRCEICQKVFSRSGHLSKHMLMHKGEKPFQCEECDKSYRAKDQLENHIRSHTGEKPYVCETCKKCFSRKETLTRHIRIHTGEKPYDCKTCGERFSQRNVRKDHMRIHTGEKLYNCDHCERRFGQKSDLKRHLRTHSGEKPFKCNDCGKRFAHLRSMKSHRQRDHN